MLRPTDVKHCAEVTFLRSRQLSRWFNLDLILSSQRQQIQATACLLVALFFAAAFFLFGLLRSLDLSILALKCFGLGLVDFGTLASFGVMVGVEGRPSPPGQALKMWTSLTLRPLSSGGFAQVARTFRLTFSIHLDLKENLV